MKLLRHHPSLLVCAVISLAAALGPGPTMAQVAGPGVREAYFNAVGEHFGVDPAEVGILGEWALVPDEVPVVLFLAQRAGVSPDALFGLRRGGRPWRDVARRFGLGPRDFHLPLPQEMDLGHLARAYQEFRTRPPAEWSEIALEDTEVVALVNLRVLSAQTGAPPPRILRHFSETGSFMAAYSRLLSG